MSLYSKPLRRSVMDCHVAGVCGGLAEYFEIDATVVRVLYVLVSVFTAFSGFLVYLLLWLLIPKREYY